MENVELRTITCDIEGCENRHTEKQFGDGHPHWGQLKGINLNGSNDPHLCPTHLAQVAEFTDALRGTDNGVD